MRRPYRGKSMSTAILLMIGMIVGVALILLLMVLLLDTWEDRERHERIQREERQRKIDLRRKMNEPREDLSRNICEEARKGLQRREEG